MIRNAPSPMEQHEGAAHGPGAIKAELKRRALEEGFIDFGVCAPNAIPQAFGRLTEWLEAGRHGDMAWMERRIEERADPRRLWPEVQAVVMLAENYGPHEGFNPLANLSDPEAATISAYAQDLDYHDIVKPRLKRLGSWLYGATGAPVKVFVDTAPVMEKPLAQAAGLGWQGKHTNLVSREAGSWTFLAAIYTAFPLPPDAPEIDHCGSCRKCLEACPTAAFPAPYQLDARRCVSYLTIEHKGPIPHEFRVPMGNRIYGCDDCLAVCPWNKFAQAAREMAYQGVAFQHPMLAHLLDISDDASFRQIFHGSPIKRIGRARLMRNVLIAAGNSGNRALIPAAMKRLEDEEPLARGAAVWALSRLMAPEDFAALAAKRPEEPDAEAAAEWEMALRKIKSPSPSFPLEKRERGLG